MIAAMARNGVIGNVNALPWRLSSDLKRFRRATMGKAIILGRKTMESIGKPLPGRHMIVLTRQADFSMSGVAVARSVDEARVLAESLGDPDEAMVIGGEAVYRAFFPFVDVLLLTVVDTVCAGDARFPLELCDGYSFEVASFDEFPPADGDDFTCTLYRLTKSETRKPIDWRGRVRPIPPSSREME